MEHTTVGGISMEHTTVGDVVVVKMGRPLSFDTASRVRDIVGPHFPDSKVLVIDNDMDVTLAKETDLKGLHTAVSGLLATINQALTNGVKTINQPLTKPHGGR